MESSNEISINVPAVQPSNPVESLGLPLALNCPSGPTVIDMQGNEGGAFLPCADSPVPVSNTTPSSQPPLSVSTSPTPPPCVDGPYTQPPPVFTSTTVSLISIEAREVPPVITNTTSSPIPTEARDKEASPPDTESISVSIQAETQFVPSLGSWAKPLIFKPVPTPPVPSTPKDYDPALVGNQLAALWPSLNDEILNKKPKSKHPTRSLELPVAKLPPPELKADGTLRFPWATRLSPESRNLYRAASPTYRLDGTPEVPNDSSLPPLECHFIKDVPEECQASNTPQIQHDNQLAQQTLTKTLSPLVDIASTPISAYTMEFSPSNIINREVQKASMVDPLNTSAQVSEFQSPSRFAVLGDVDMAPDETASSLGFTRGRESRPPIKFQDLVWKTTQGRGKHGRRGRGNTR
ncbi:hypothetical protein HID58_055343 [Brassica napus]|uniref:Uncharacterized protein n=2 Tax=Brassica napus TaxID=3708 RepID=A0ABQ8AK10_BRANA|nr:hypothetical protein HID58_055343 [Brassica napus]